MEPADADAYSEKVLRGSPMNRPRWAKDAQLRISPWMRRWSDSASTGNSKKP
ncbi:MAG TPA: hypothetical protein VIS29_21635 [Streptomyces sp.]|jgi:hypothetical protein